MTALQAHNQILAAGTTWIYMAADIAATLIGSALVSHDKRD